MLAVFEGTPMYREALREIYHDRLDITLAKRVLERITGWNDHHHDRRALAHWNQRPRRRKGCHLTGAC